jgi:hypothetical protein
VTTPTASPIVVSGTSGNAVSPIEIDTASPHGLTTGDLVTVRGVRGNTAANVTSAAITVTGASKFTVVGTGNGAFVTGGGVWKQGSKLASATLTKVDAAIPLRVTDKTGDSVYGAYTVTGDVTLAAGAAVLTDPYGGAIYTASGGRYELGDGDDVEFVQVDVDDAGTPSATPTPIARSIVVSMLEAVSAYDATAGSTIGAALNPPGIVCGTWGTSPAPGLGAFRVPLTRLHNGATLVRVTLYFFPRVADPTAIVLPTVFPTVDLRRLDPSTDVATESIAVAQAPAPFAGPSLASEYAQTPALGSAGFVVLATSPGAPPQCQITALQPLVSPSGQSYEVTTTGTYDEGDPIPVRSVGAGAVTNVGSFTALTWVTIPASGSTPATLPPTNAAATALVDSNGLTGGIDGGYAQTLVLTVDPTLAEVDLSTYTYQLVVTDDNAVGVGGWNSTVYVAAKLDFEGIADLSPQ